MEGGNIWTRIDEGGLQKPTKKDHSRTGGNRKMSSDENNTGWRLVKGVSEIENFIQTKQGVGERHWRGTNRRELGCARMRERGPSERKRNTEEEVGPERKSGGGDRGGKKRCLLKTTT